MDFSYLVGLMSIFIFLYRFLYLLVPMFNEGLKNKNYDMIFKSLTLLV